MLAFWRFVYVGPTDPLASSYFAQLAEGAPRRSEPFSLLIFPEGDFVRVATSAASSNFAKTLGEVRSSTTRVIRS